MLNAETFRNFALSLPNTDEHPHHGLVSFRVNKKVFATLNAPEKRATLRFTLELQDVFCAVGKGSIYPVASKWGKYGWTHISLETGDWEMCQDAIQTAWCTVAPPKLLAKYPELSGEEA